jgi:hypothetical protein
MLLPSKVKDRRCGFVVNGPESHRPKWGEELPTRVCDLRTPRGFNGYSEGEANARLIATAPELLEELCNAREWLDELCGLIQFRRLDAACDWVEANELVLHPTKTKIIDAKAEGFDFLGYHFHRDGYKWPREKSLKKFKETIREKTRRNNGMSMEMIIANVNRTRRGWYAYFKHCKRWIFERIDVWIRRRLRSILRQRIGLRGISPMGRDHHRWRNAYFEHMGLFSLLNAHILECQSLTR